MENISPALYENTNQKPVKKSNKKNKPKEIDLSKLLTILIVFAILLIIGVLIFTYISREQANLIPNTNQTNETIDDNSIKIVSQPGIITEVYKTFGTLDHGVVLDDKLYLSNSESGLVVEDDKFVINNNIIGISTKYQGQYYRNRLKKLEVFNSTSNSWIFVGKMPFQSPGIVKFQDKLYLFTRYNDYGNSLIYDGEKFTNITECKGSHGINVAVVYDNYLYAGAKGCDGNLCRYDNLTWKCFGGVTKTIQNMISFKDNLIITDTESVYSFDGTRVTRISKGLDSPTVPFDNFVIYNQTLYAYKRNVHEGPRTWVYHEPTQTWQVTDFNDNLPVALNLMIAYDNKFYFTAIGKLYVLS